MDVLGIVGSAREGHQTEWLVQHVLDYVEELIPGTMSDVLRAADGLYRRLHDLQFAVQPAV